ncbi:MAG: hypothetical protein ACHREM_15280 [Polyangiales bacterium]
MHPHRLLPGVALTAFALLFPACFGESNSVSGASGGGVAVTTTDGGATIPDDPPNQSVVVDVGTAPRASSGDGAGVFVGYRGNGQWDVSWTCDTNVSHLGCVFDLSLRGQSLSVSNALPTTAVTSSTSEKIVTHTLTAAETDTLSLTATPGAPLILAARFNGDPQPSLVFFVENGAIVSATSDPLQLTPASP